MSAPASTKRANGTSPKDVTDLRDIIGRDKLLPTLLNHAESVDLSAYPAGGVALSKGEQPDWPEVFTRGTLAGTELRSLVIPPRAKLLADWFCEGDLGFLFAARGVGKTWLSLIIALAVAEGGKAGPWPAASRHPVLYVDGEMPLELMQEREKGLARGDGLIRYLNHEQLFNETGQVLNLTDPACQNGVTALCVAEGIKLIVLDNLSCLFRGVKENDADAWEHILPWLLEMRRRKIAVLFVCHAGRNAQMRGTSRREDAAAWVIRLDDAGEAAAARTGAKFIHTFTKPSRNTPDTPPPLEWTVTTNATGGSMVAYKEAEGEEAVVGWVRYGLTTCSEIAEEMHLSKGAVSKMATRLMEAGRLTRKGREYALPLAGDAVEEAE